MKLTLRHLLVLCIVIGVGCLMGFIVKQRAPLPLPPTAETPTEKPVIFQQTDFPADFYQEPHETLLPVMPEASLQENDSEPETAPEPPIAQPAGPVAGGTPPISPDETQPGGTDSPEVLDLQGIPAENNPEETQTPLEEDTSEDYIPPFLH